MWRSSCAFIHAFQACWNSSSLVVVYIVYKYSVPTLEGHPFVKIYKDPLQRPLLVLNRMISISSQDILCQKTIPYWWYMLPFSNIFKYNYLKLYYPIIAYCRNSRPVKEKKPLNTKNSLPTEIALVLCPRKVIIFERNYCICFHEVLLNYFTCSCRILLIVFCVALNAHTCYSCLIVFIYAEIL